MRKKIVAVIGNKKIEPDGIRYRLRMKRENFWWTTAIVCSRADWAE